MKHKHGRAKMEMIYRGVALYFLTEKGDGYVPTHCDVRCACNDLMDRLEKDGWQVNHHYSQDKAFKGVRRLLSVNEELL